MIDKRFYANFEMGQENFAAIRERMQDESAH